MKRFKSILIIFLLIVLAFPAGIGHVRAIDVADIPVDEVPASITDSGNAVTNFIGSVFGAIGGFFAGIFNFLTNLTPEGIAKAIIGFVTTIINAIIIAIASLFWELARVLVHYAVLLTDEISSSGIIKAGFDIVLDVVNLGLVVSIVAISFMTMLRRPKASSLLVRFIVIALLINFSYHIAINFIIIPVNEIVMVLFEAANFDKFALASVFTGGFSGDVIGELPGIDGFAAGIAQSVISILFTAAFMGGGAFSLLSFAVMLFIRYVALGFLIILMPLALLAWVFPNLKLPGGSPFEQWSSQFTRWVLFAPISMFFFFLSIRAVSEPNVLARGETTNAMITLGTRVGDMAIIVGLMLGGIIVANKMSITGAKLADNQLKKAGKWVKGRAWEKTKIAGTYAARRAGREFDDEGKRLRKPTLTERAQRAGRENGIIGKTLKAPLRGLGNVAANARIAGEKAYKTAKERVDKLSIDEMEKRFDSEGGAGQLAILTNIFGEIKKLNEKEEKGKKDHGATFTLDKDDERRRDRLIVIRDRIGNETNLRGRMEKLRGLYGQDVMRVGKKAEELFEAAKEEGRTEVRTSAPTLSPAPPPTAPTAPTP